MNSPSKVEKNTPSFLEQILSKIAPDTFLFWVALPLILLLGTLAVSFLKPTPLAIYLPFIALISSILCIRWRAVGLCASLVAVCLLFFGFLNKIPDESRMWQIGILFALSSDFFILFLSVEEIGSLLSQLTETGKAKGKELLQVQLKLQHLQDEWKTEKKNLEEEIEELKEEAEQRRIEKQQHTDEINLVQSEIELLTSQKAYFVEEAKKAREIIEKDAHSVQAFHAIEAEKDKLFSRLGQTQKECTDLSTQLKATQLEKEELLTRLEQAQEKCTDLATQLKTIQPEATHSKESVVATQQMVIALQQRSPTLVKQPVEVKKLEGMYKQLRTQFEEKTRVLAQTRKELFQEQSKFLAAEQEAKLEELSPDREREDFYEKQLNTLVEEVNHLEEEVETLEMVVMAQSRELESHDPSR